MPVPETRAEARAADRKAAAERVMDAAITRWHEKRSEYVDAEADMHAAVAAAISSGITAQSAADKIGVTRQAVSKRLRS